MASAQRMPLEILAYPLTVTWNEGLFLGLVALLRGSF
jgi:hypothetical protein